MSITKLRLTHGLTFLYDQIPYVPTFSLGILINVGSRDEIGLEYGYAHFLEHILFKNITNGGPKKVASAIDALGGHVNAGTSRENTSFYATVTPDLLPEAMKLLFDLVFFPKFDNKDVEREKKVVGEEIRMYKDSPEDDISDLLFAQVFNKSGLAHTELGTEESIKECNLEKLLKFYQKHYCAENIIIAAAGQLPVERVLEIVEKNLIRNNITIPSSTSKSNNQIRKGKKINFIPSIAHKDKKELEQMQFIVALPGYSAKDDENTGLELINILVGGSQSSLLVQEIREKRGLCYHIGSQRVNFQDCGFWGIFGATQCQQIDFALSAIFSQLQNLRMKFYSEQKVKAAKNYLRVNLLMAMESSDYRMSRMVRNFNIFGRMVEMNEILSKIESTKRSDIIELYDTLLDLSKLTMITLGNAEFMRLNLDEIKNDYRIRN